MYDFKITGIHPLDQYVDYPVVLTQIGEDLVTVKITPTWANGCICIAFKNGNVDLLSIEGWFYGFKNNKTGYSFNEWSS